jgi:hypothetical protein
MINPAVTFDPLSRAMRLAVIQICASTIALLLVALWPRTGQPVLLALAPGAAAGAAFAAEGWRIQRIIEVGPMPFLVATPDTPDADPAILRRTAGAVMAIAAHALVACAPDSR